MNKFKTLLRLLCKQIIVEIAGMIVTNDKIVVETLRMTLNQRFGDESDGSTNERRAEGEGAVQNNERPQLWKEGIVRTLIYMQ
ncbi:hypothetical protein RHMOL_Rhmol02G0216100 [Rhododendron molle]|nr:hypothetical protein RHMOL_Rhmol02G0216100 [Rhododendron molle]